MGAIVRLAGREAMPGRDLLQDPERQVEAALAVRTRQLTLAGPFQLLGGEMGVVGRLPVFLPAAHGEERFWGSVGAVMAVPRLIAAARLDQMEEFGLFRSGHSPQPPTATEAAVRYAEASLAT